MDDQEQEEILYRLDERTKRVDETLNRLEKDVRENSAEIEKVSERTQKNTTAINFGKGAVGIIGTVLSAVAAKITGIVTI